MGTAAQAVTADQPNGEWAAPFIFCQANLGTTYNGVHFSDYITGKLAGEYQMTVTGGVSLSSATHVYAAQSTVTTLGDPWYSGLYFNEDTAQFQNAKPAANHGAQNVGAAGNQPSAN